MNTDEHRFDESGPGLPLHPASRKRQWFAWYLDLWILAPVVHGLSYAAGIYQYRWPITVVLLFFIEWIVGRFYIRSVGDYALGIVRSPDTPPMVEAELRSAANWFVILVAFMELHSGSRMISRGAIEYDFYYFFGQPIEGFQAQFFLAFLGLVGIIVSVFVFRCRKLALPLVLGLTVFEFVNNLASTPLATEVAELVIAKRNAARPGREVPITPEQLVTIQLVWNTVYLGFVGALGYVFRQRFRFSGSATGVGAAPMGQ
jgi:hypothetical protein